MDTPKPRYEVGSAVLYMDGYSDEPMEGVGHVIEVTPVTTYVYKVKWSDDNLTDEYEQDSLVPA